MLEAAGVPFETVDADFDEDGVKASLRAQGSGAAELALGLAREKARAVNAAADDLVLGSDQTLELDDGIMLDKPTSKEELEQQLRRLSGRTHKLHSAAALVQRGEQVWSATETVQMHVRELGPGFIRDYVDREYATVRRSVGGYHVEGRGAQLFDGIDGSQFAVQGLPLLPLLGALRERSLLPA
jgi:septum formation protein